MTELKVDVFLTGLNEDDVLIANCEQFFMLRNSGFKVGDKIDLRFDVVSVSPIEEGKQFVIVKRH